MHLPKAKLEHWMRDYYFDCDFDLGSSGVYSYNFEEVCKQTGLTIEDMNKVVFDDSPTVGCFSLRKALAERYGDGNADNVMVANGSNEVLFHLLSTLLEPADEVVALDTIYHALDAVPIAKNCKIKRWTMSADANFRVDIDALEALVTPNTKLIAVNFPHNPSGVSISQTQQDQLINIARSVDAYLVWDAAFHELVHDTPLNNPFFSYNKAISVGTLSKCYGMPGLRVGWCFANEDVIRKSVELRDYTTLYVSPLIEMITTKVIENAEYFIGNRLAEVDENRAYLKKWLAQHNNVSWSFPEGGVSCLIQIEGVSNMDDFCKDLAKEYSVMLVPGSCFGLDKYARLGFGEIPKKFAVGLERMSAFLADLQIPSKDILHTSSTR